MLQLSITGFYASLLALLYLGLTINIIRLRLSLQIGIGSGGNKVLAAAIRIHGNFAEYVPLALILLACYELNNGDATILHAIGALLIISRVFHAIGLSKSIGASLQRQIAMLSTFVVLIVLAVVNIRLFIVA
ncbi:hypothetical protein SAMN05216262_103155 [Colwellia chukchiensis]|uniref:Glutathione S-transferase n=1 Tax=Colwellia chukchiensis TaxID=641665 RepID=A0A1H7KI91_9GAMM|nr:MAPEG family protein [Colwellia chukchiensis]SEK86581.1 hypothetical protein SAMN05216262_103155 [Colwellia chukchiensis]